MQGKIEHQKTHKNSEFQFSDVWFNVNSPGLNLTSHGLKSNSTSHQNKILHSQILYFLGSDICHIMHYMSFQYSLVTPEAVSISGNTLLNGELIILH